MTQPEPAILDEDVLDELRTSVDGDRSFVVELIEAYVADGATHVAEVEAAVADGDAGSLVRPAHTLKSSSATVGAQRLAALARDLELAGRSGSLDASIAERVPQLRDAWEEATAALRGWVERGGSG
jgi:HPt (histidine-containing phosphotransfer) domain-containing protein